MSKLNRAVFAALLAACLVFSCTGCVVVGINSTYVDKDAAYGEGEIKTIEYAAEDFTALDIDCDAVLTYKAGTSDTISVDIYENLVENLDVSVENGTLKIYSDVSFVDSNNMPVITVTAPTLESVMVEGEVLFEDWEVVTGESFKLTVAGAGSASIELDVNSLDINLAGACNIELGGRADTARINIAGTGNVSAMELVTIDASVIIAGLGSVEITCDGALDINISGMGDVIYSGDAKVNKIISGFGSVEKE